jgi:hypothetical protein
MLKPALKLILALVLPLLTLVYFTHRVFSQETSLPDTGITLAIKPLEANVFASPQGDIIGKIRRGRVINVLESNAEWLMFTTWDFPIGWLSYQDAVTLEEWKNLRKTFLTESSRVALEDKFHKILATPQEEIFTIKNAIIAYDSLVKVLDFQINNGLERILSLRDSIAQGRLPAKKGVKLIEAERTIIESHFNQITISDTIEALNEAKSAMENKHRAIDKGLQYLMRYFLNGRTEDANIAGYHFQLAQNAIDDYTRAIFQVKTEYGIYRK